MTTRTKGRFRRWAVATVGGLGLSLVPAWYWTSRAPAVHASPAPGVVSPAPAAGGGDGAGVGAGPRLPVVAPVAAPIAPAAAAAAQPVLPVKDVVLFSSGIGYFERAGKVNGDANVELKFKVGDVNDLLKSLVVEDHGQGVVSAVTYASRDPITKTLRSFAVDLTGNPTLGQLLTQVRGEQVQVATATNNVLGRILGVEKKKTISRDGTVVESEVLNLAGETGLRSLPMDQVISIKLVNAELDRELQQALTVLAGGHDTQKKSVDIRFVGKGERDVRVGYVVENPIWKTSYRLTVDAEGKLWMQGWAIVENTGDEDWNGVRLTLVSGRPISFIQDLYQPLYVPRPVVQQQLYASINPQLYDEALEKGDLKQLAADRDGNLREEADGLADKRRYAQNAAPAAPPAFGRGAPAAKAAEQFRMLDSAKTAVAQATGGRVGELFKYGITVPVTLPRQKSAMIPIINGKVEGKKVSIYNAGVQAAHPLFGLKLKNDTGVHLSPGPITVYADGIYGGDARVEDVRPDEERLLSYGIDLAVAASSEYKGETSEVTTIRLRNGVLHFEKRAEKVLEYTFKNNDNRPRTILVEHAYASPWTLVEPAKFDEKTASSYRFSVEVAGGKTVKLPVKETMPIHESVTLSNLNSASILFQARATKLSPAAKKLVEDFAGLKGKLEKANRDRAVVEAQIRELETEQERVKRLMTGLTEKSDLYARYVKKLDDHETAIEKLRSDLKARRAEETAAQEAVNTFLRGMTAE